MPPHGLILILEDSAARNASFQAAIELGGMVSCIAADSATFLQLARDSKRPGLVSLDHDLKPTDVLDGLAVLREILQLWADAPVPVVVHTSNVERGAQMMGELELADWPHERVLPFGDDWVARAGYPASRACSDGSAGDAGARRLDHGCLGTRSFRQRLSA